MSIYKQAWHTNYENNRSDLEDLYTRDPFNNWDKNRMPDSAANRQFNNGLDFLYADDPDDYAKKFIQRSIDVVQRALDENKFSSDLCKIRYPENLAEALRIQVYAKYLMGSGLSSAQLLTSAEKFKETVENSDEKGDFPEWFVMSAVRLCLIANDIDKANEMMALKTTIRYNKAEAKLWKRLIKLAGKPDEKLKEEFFVWFDEVRDPNYKVKYHILRNVLRFEAGLIAMSYFFGKPGFFTEELIACISK